MKSKFNFRSFFKRKTNFEKALKSMQKLTINDLRSFRLAVNKRFDRLSTEIIYDKMRTDKNIELEVGRILDVMHKINDKTL